MFDNLWFPQGEGQGISDLVQFGEGGQVAATPPSGSASLGISATMHLAATPFASGGGCSSALKPVYFLESPGGG
jgi:hypothetical protein